MGGRVRSICLALCVFITAVPITKRVCVDVLMCVYYCSTYYKAVRGEWRVALCVCVCLLLQDLL
jgi:hypothetical protein